MGIRFDTTLDKLIEDFSYGKVDLLDIFEYLDRKNVTMMLDNGHKGYKCTMTFGRKTSIQNVIYENGREAVIAALESLRKNAIS